jgi:DNA-binding response OmpR family regulator
MDDGPDTMPNVDAETPTMVPAPHVLVVEDQERAARGLEEILSIQGFEVTRASDGPSAIAAAVALPIDAIVLDVLLPGMDGFEVCRRLRSMESTRHVPILLLTALSDTPSKVRGFDIGADDYMVKPVAARELAARIHKHLSKRRQNACEVHQQRLRAIGEIATAVGHEVNNPLAAAAGTLEMVLLRSDLAADTRRDLVQCQDQLWRIATVLSQLSEVRDETVPYVGPDRMIDLTREART